MPFTVTAATFFLLSGFRLVDPTAARRADETASRLEKELFQRLAELRSGEETDLVAAMARAETAEPVEPETGGESEG
jgi:hypothetical protein